MRDEIRKLLVLSTTHLSRETARLLDNTDPRQEWPAAGGHYGPHGWFFYCAEENGGGDPPIPDDLFAVMQFARAKGCDHVLLDCDASPAEGLPVYEWDEEPNGLPLGSTLDLRTAADLIGEPVIYAMDGSEDEDDVQMTWRDLALQFDAHRIEAMSHIRALLDAGGHPAQIEQARKFLAAPPLLGEQVLADRLSAILQRQSDAVTEAMQEALRFISDIDNSHESVRKLRKAIAATRGQHS